MMPTGFQIKSSNLIPCKSLKLKEPAAAVKQPKHDLYDFKISATFFVPSKIKTLVLNVPQLFT